MALTWGLDDPQLGRGSDGCFGLRRFRAPQPRLALTALSLTPCHPPSASILSLRPYRLVFSRCRPRERKKKPTPAEGKNMKLEEVNLKTKEAVNYLVQSLEAGQSAVLTQYLGAMAKFRNYSFGNIMLIARQKPDATNVAGLRTWNSLGRFVRRGEKGIFILAPMVGNKRNKKEENAEQNTDARETHRTLYGFRGVYVFDRLSRDLRPEP